jgi:uncharacterized protein (DUF952 family)
MARIYHFINKSNLARDLNEKSLHVPSLESQGFIHCSTLEQVVSVANLIAPYDEEMHLIEIEEDRVTPEVRYENLEGGEMFFPHIYGPLNQNAIVAIHPFEWDGEEGYVLPEELQERA